MCHSQNTSLRETVIFLTTQHTVIKSTSTKTKVRVIFVLEQPQYNWPLLPKPKIDELPYHVVCDRPEQIHISHRSNRYQTMRVKVRTKGAISRRKSKIRRFGVSQNH
ncbi:hypothetical protein M0804_014208 [Polistes exclamans]|nr:hypothetical protein M0804_014208 [Polistes exclamans]